MYVRHVTNLTFTTCLQKAEPYIARLIVNLLGVMWSWIISVLSEPSSDSFQIQYEITRVRQKMKDLALLHDKHMNRPTLDDSSEEEHAIEITTQEITQVQSFTKKANSFKLIFCWKSCVDLHLIINHFNWRVFLLKQSVRRAWAFYGADISTYDIRTRKFVSYHSLVWRVLQMFHRCQRAVTGLQSRCGHCTEQEERLLRNVVSSLAQSLQELSTNFRHTQSSYLKRKSCSVLFACCGFWLLCAFIEVVRHIILLCVCIPGMKNREERSKHFFDSGPLMEEDEDLAIYDKVVAVWKSYLKVT